MFTKFGFACHTVTILPYLLIVYNITESPDKVNAVFIFCLYNLFFIYYFYCLLPFIYTLLTFSSSSSNTKSAYFPGVILPHRSKIPISFAGFIVAHPTASSSGTPIFCTATRRHPMRFVAEPAIVPSASVAFGPFKDVHTVAAQLAAHIAEEGLDRLLLIIIAAQGHPQRLVEELFIAQPSLTQALHRAEEEYGAVFFQRGKSGLKVTDAGKMYLDAENRMEKLYNEGKPCQASATYIVAI